VKKEETVKEAEEKEQKRQIIQFGLTEFAFYREAGVMEVLYALYRNNHAVLADGSSVFELIQEYEVARGAVESALHRLPCYGVHMDEWLPQLPWLEEQDQLTEQMNKLSAMAARHEASLVKEEEEKKKESEADRLRKENERLQNELATAQAANQAQAANLTNLFTKGGGKEGGKEKGKGGGGGKQSGGGGGKGGGKAQPGGGAWHQGGKQGGARGGGKGGGGRKGYKGAK
jgi:hypothetical protein